MDDQSTPERDPYAVVGDEPCAILGRPPAEALPEHRAERAEAEQAGAPGPQRIGGPSTYVATINEGVFRTFQVTHGATGRQVNIRLRPVPTGYTGGQAAWETAAQARILAALDATHASGSPNNAHTLLGAR